MLQENIIVNRLSYQECYLWQQ